VAVISVNAVIEINVFDYNVHARARHVRIVNEALRDLEKYATLCVANTSGGSLF